MTEHFETHGGTKMTTMSDAFDKAGFNTAAARLRAMIEAAMEKCHENVPRALEAFTRETLNKRDLHAELCRSYFVANLPGTQPSDDAHRSHGSGRPAGDQSHADSQSGRVSRRKVSVKKHTRNAPALRELEAQTMHAAFTSRLIGGRLIGTITWGELTTLVAEHASDAASYLRAGTLATENALLLHKIKQHAIVDDHSRKISEVIPVKAYQRFETEAKREAPDLIERGIAEHKRRITTYLEEDHARA
jgi:hypothetical protein